MSRCDSCDRESKRRIMAFMHIRVSLIPVLTILLPLLLGQVEHSHAASLCAEFILPKGYPCTEFIVETEDGFLLGLQNIPNGILGPSNSNSTGPAVFLIHGLSGGGDNFALNDPRDDLCFILADAGFDVYIGSNRNTQWSHGSSRYTPDEKAYWDWTWDELAAYDVPAFVDFIYNRRGGSKLFYVGHSQGTLTLFAGLVGGGPRAEQMKDKIRGAVYLGPSAYVTYLNALISAVTFDTFADKILPTLGIGPADFSSILKIICDSSNTICSDIFLGYLGTNSYIDNSRKPIYLKSFSQASSTYNFNHFGQTRRSGKFRKYDRGLEENLQKYGQKEPPLYNLAKFPSDKFPQLFFVGGRDQVANPRDADRLLQELPDTGNREVVSLNDYGHVDVIIGQRAYLDVYPKIVSFLNSN